jgi:hypothetical protein
MELLQVQHLLDQICLIKSHYDRISELNGENFNIFQIVGIESSELAHSRFLAELLNPKGSHGQKDTFLKLFCEQVGNTKVETSNAIVKLESHIGAINNEHSEGGRIDILIHDGKSNSIIIENKIYAGDQKGQIDRYIDYARKTYKQSWQVVYLTLNGEEPSEWSSNQKASEEFKQNVSLVSYYTDIVNWLTKCQKECVNQHLLREALAQYLNTLTRLTQKSNIMLEEIKSILTKDTEKIKAFVSISSAFAQMNEDKFAGIVTGKIQQQLKSEGIEHLFQYAEYLIELHCWQDSTNGFCIGYNPKQGSQGLGLANNPDLKPLREILMKQKLSGIKSNNNYLAWYKPLGIYSLKQIDAEKRVLYMIEEVELEKFISEIIIEIRENALRFKEEALKIE